MRLSYSNGDAHANGDCWPPTCGACIDEDLAEQIANPSPHELVLWFSGNGTSQAECSCRAWKGPRRDTATEAIRDHWAHLEDARQEEES